MKKLFSLFIAVIFLCSANTAQTTIPVPPNPPTTSESTSVTSSRQCKKTEISINTSKNRKLNLKINNQDFDLDIDFGNIQTEGIRKLLTKYLGTPKASFLGAEEWSDADKTYNIRLRKGSLEASFDKDELSNKEFEKLSSFVKDVFSELDWEVDLDVF